MIKHIFIIVGVFLFADLYSQEPDLGQIATKDLVFTQTYYMNNKRLRFSELNDILTNIKETEQEIKSAKKKYKTSLLFSIPSAYLIISELSRKEGRGSINLGIGLLLSGVASFYEIQMHAHYHNAVSFYNKQLTIKEE